MRFCSQNNTLILIYMNIFCVLYCQQLASRNGYEYIETSAITGKNTKRVCEIFICFCCSVGGWLPQQCMGYPNYSRAPNRGLLYSALKVTFFKVNTSAYYTIQLVTEKEASLEMILFHSYTYSHSISWQKLLSTAEEYFYQEKRSVSLLYHAMYLYAEGQFLPYPCTRICSVIDTDTLHPYRCTMCKFTVSDILHRLMHTKEKKTHQVLLVVKQMMQYHEQ